MERLIFREEQPIRQSFLPWLFIPVWLFTVVLFSFGFYQQLYLGKQFGDEPMSDSGLLWSGILTILFLSALFLVLLSGVLVTEVWTDGIRYKFPPLLRRLKYIPLNEIVSAEVGKYKPIAEFGGWGWRRRFLSRKTAYNISGNIGLRIILSDGRQVVLGTCKKDDMQRAIDKMWQRDKEKYSM